MLCELRFTIGPPHEAEIEPHRLLNAGVADMYNERIGQVGRPIFPRRERWFWVLGICPVELKVVLQRDPSAARLDMADAEMPSSVRKDAKHARFAPGKLLRAEEESRTGSGRGQPTPMGLDYCGIVEKVGPAIKSIKPGQFIIGSFFASNNTCSNCHIGYQSSCQQRELVGGA